MHRNLSYRHRALCETLQNLNHHTERKSESEATKMRINTNALLKEAESSEHKEAYQTLDKTQNFRIGIGVRLTPPNPPSFFIEVLIHLYSNSDAFDLKQMESSLTCLKELQARNYILTHQDDNCFSCEKVTPAQNLAEEYEAVKSLLKAHSC